VVHFGDQQLFESATTYTCLMFLAKRSRDDFRLVRVDDLAAWRSDVPPIEGDIGCPGATGAEWNFHIGPAGSLIERLRATHTCLGDATERIFQGLKTGADPVFILEVCEGGYYSKALNECLPLEETYLRPLCKSGDFKRYDLKSSRRVIIFPYEQGTLVPWPRILERAPGTAAYLKTCQSLLNAREHGRWIGPVWYGYSRAQALQVIAQPKILTADLNPSASFCVDEDGTVCFPGGAAGGYGVLAQDISWQYVLGLLNSRLLDWFLKRVSTQFRGGWYSFEAKYIRQLPMRPIDFDDPEDVERHDQMVTLVERMLDLHKRLPEAKTPQKRQRLEREIRDTDAAIDALVYELYDLTPEEIAIVEGSGIPA